MVDAVLHRFILEEFREVVAAHFHLEADSIEVSENLAFAGPQDIVRAIDTTPTSR